MSLSIPSIKLPSALENAYFAIVLEAGKERATHQCNHLFDVVSNKVLWERYNLNHYRAKTYQQWALNFPSTSSKEYRSRMNISLTMNGQTSQSIALLRARTVDNQ